ncbi:hypothetical protein SDJN02_01112, partial [Cucurbita argyrosperma subsp. argyrosperma]
MKKINSLLRKCKTLSRQLGSFRSKSKSTTEHLWVSQTKMEEQHQEHQEQHQEHQEHQQEHERLQKVSSNNVIIYVGSTRKRYSLTSNHLTHPLLTALIHKSKANEDCETHTHNNNAISLRCEVVLFDHLLWMLENSDPNLTFDSNLEELAELYVF